MEKLPDYVAIDVRKNIHPDVLRHDIKKLDFPLNEQDLKDVKILEQKFDQEQNCAGLAAPQIGIPKQIIVFAAPEDQELKKWREDFTQSMDKTIWINPSYEPIGTDVHQDYEGCFSVVELAGEVKRYKKVKYKAYTLEGKLIEGTAEGFLARIIQHEVDHIHGKLFIDYVPKDELMTIDEYRKKRQDALES